MPSFDVTSSVNMHEVTNAVDQVKRELSQRYDFKGTKAEVVLKEAEILIDADDDLRLKAINELLKQKLAKRGVSLKSVKFGEIEKAGGDTLRQKVEVKQSLNEDELKRLSKLIKEQKIKVNAQIQGEQLRVTGKKRDDLQEIISALKATVQDLELQFGNFRD